MRERGRTLGIAGAGLARSPRAVLAGLAQLTRQRAARGRGGSRAWGPSLTCAGFSDGARRGRGASSAAAAAAAARATGGRAGALGGGAVGPAAGPAPPAPPASRAPSALLPPTPLSSGLRGSALRARYFPGCGGKSCGSSEPRPAPPCWVLAPAPVGPGEGARSGRCCRPTEGWGPVRSNRCSEEAKDHGLSE